MIEINDQKFLFLINIHNFNDNDDHVIIKKIQHILLKNITIIVIHEIR